MSRDPNDNTSETGANADRPVSGFRDTYPGKDNDSPRNAGATDALRQIREDAQDRAADRMDDRDTEVTRTRRDASSPTRDDARETTRTQRRNDGPGTDDLGNLSETGANRSGTPTSTAPAGRTLRPGPGGQGLPPGCTAPKVLMLTLTAVLGQVFKR